MGIREGIRFAPETAAPNLLRTSTSVIHADDPKDWLTPSWRLIDLAVDKIREKIRFSLSIMLMYVNTDLIHDHAVHVLCFYGFASGTSRANSNPWSVSS